ncbi:MAG: beta-propeller domain-containing protein, partial [archaeon GB-1867-035]|nr:beta-propeller domain-containing protein [Candidatus Culexmicrobium profundum]
MSSKINLKTTLLLILTIGILISTSISVIKIPEKEIIETPDIKTFKSLEELRSYIESSRTSYIYHPLLETTMAPMFAVEEQARKYSTTNIQVTGVDEADIIKTDGKYIYIASGNKVYIIKAYPPENAEIINTLNFNATVRGLFINKERLVIITSTTSYVRIMIEKNETISIPKIPYQIINTTILIYDTSNIVKPILINSINATGSYVTSRMINNHVYIIVQQYISSDIIILPEINGIQVKPTQIKYIVGESGHQFTTIIAINISNGEYRSE